MIDDRYDVEPETTFLYHLRCDLHSISMGYNCLVIYIYIYIYIYISNKFEDEKPLI